MVGKYEFTVVLPFIRALIFHGRSHETMEAVKNIACTFPFSSRLNSSFWFIAEDENLNYIYFLLENIISFLNFIYLIPLFKFSVMWQVLKTILWLIFFVLVQVRMTLSLFTFSWRSNMNIFHLKTVLWFTYSLRTDYSI